MTRGLVRYQECGHHHFVTFSCFHREPLLGCAAARVRFEQSLELMRVRYDFVIMAYVVMPEHVHLLLTEPERGTLTRALQALKISVSRLARKRPFWQARYYDFNVFTDRKRVEKLQYIHRNPVTRGLVASPEDWPWSSYRYYLTGESGRVRLETWKPVGSSG